ncbi:MAG TPA: thiolase family protein [Polyangiaceae bacterium]|nr:thiolase family protein [Polyangiaceae bacterium]
MTFPMNVVVASAVRSAVGRANKGTLRQTRPEDLAGALMDAAVKRVAGLSADQIDDVILGCAMPEAEQGWNVARNAAFVAKFPNHVPAQTVNRFCSSGLQTIADAALSIHAGLSDVVVAGGVESMSAVPMGGNKISVDPTLVDTMPEAYISMGHTAERVAERFSVSREEQDAFAARSHERAIAAIAAGRFKDEIVPVKARGFKDGKVVYSDFEIDECPRAGTTVQGLSQLRPVFRNGGTVTAGNSSPLNDGAAAAVLLSDKRAAELGVKALGRVRGFAVVGVDPDIMGIGPVPAIRKLLKQTGLQLSDIDLFELNEAFAAQAVYCQRELGISSDKLNVNGGAIALGHPLGCTGAKLTATLLHELRRRGGKYGIVSMCIGGGMGAAGLFEAA